VNPLAAIDDGDDDGFGTDGLGVATSAVAVGASLCAGLGVAAEGVVDVFVAVGSGVSWGFGDGFGVGFGVGLGVGLGVGVALGVGVGVAFGVGVGMGCGVGVGVGCGVGDGCGGGGGGGGGDGVTCGFFAGTEKREFVAVPLRGETLPPSDPVVRAIVGGVAEMRDTTKRPASPRAQPTLMGLRRERAVDNRVSRSVDGT